MQHKKIKVGEAYGVIARRTHRARPVKGTVLRTDAEYEVRRNVGFRTIRETRHDGIEVEFDEPMISSYSLYDSYEPAVNPNLRDDVNEQRMERARKRVVVPARCITEPWAVIAEREEKRAAADNEFRLKMDKLADETEPIVAAVYEKLDTRGIVFECKATQREGIERKRTVDARFTFDLDQIAQLLGVAVEDNDSPKEET